MEQSQTAHVQFTMITVADLPLEIICSFLNNGSLNSGQTYTAGLFISKILLFHSHITLFGCLAYKFNFMFLLLTLQEKRLFGKLSV